MKKLGLALSGGGFRASLYHLGLVRFLRDAGLLSQVSQITSVSGGSVLAAHLVMDRVWQLESETFRGTPGFVFAPITDIVSPHDDPTALHPVVQRQLVNVRTDFDRFSDLEISGLAQHGYCVARKACRSRPDLFGEELPKDYPWDPIPKPAGQAAPPPSTTRFARLVRGLAPGEQNGDKCAPTADTLKARTLQGSAVRRIWGRMLDYRDWASYIYVPIIIPLLILLPYFTYKAYQDSANRNDQGRMKRISPHLGRAPDEPIDQELAKFYDRLLSVIRRPAVRDGQWQLLECIPAWEGNWTWDCFLAFAWQGSDGERLLVTVNYAPNQSQCYVRLPFPGLGSRQWRFQDLLGDARYDRQGQDLQGRGLYLDVPPWGISVFSLKALHSQ